MKRLIATGLLLVFGVADLSAQPIPQSFPGQPERLESSVAASPIPLVGPGTGDQVPERKLEQLTQSRGQRAYILEQYEQMLAAQRAAGREDPIRRAEQMVDRRPDRFNAVRQVRYGDPPFYSDGGVDPIPSVEEADQIRQTSSSSIWHPSASESPYLEQPRVPPSPVGSSALFLGPEDDPFDPAHRQLDPFIDPNPIKASGTNRQDVPQRVPDPFADPARPPSPSPQDPFADPPRQPQIQPSDPGPVPPLIQTPRDSSAVPPKAGSALPPIVTPEQAMQRSGACDQPVCDQPVCDTPVRNDRMEPPRYAGALDACDAGDGIAWDEGPSMESGGQNRLASRPLFQSLPQRRGLRSRFGIENLFGNGNPSGGGCADCGGVTAGCDSCSGGYESACAGCVPTVYYSVFGGFASANDFSSAAPSSGSAASYSFDDAFAIGAAVGQIQGRQLRTELEFAYRDHDVDQVTLLSPMGNTVFNGSGELRVYSGMTNVYWEFVNSPMPALHPYVGGGVGFAFFESNFAVQGNSIVSPEYQTDSAFAYQAMAGLNWCTAPNMSMFVEYRYFATDGVRVAGSLGGNSVNGKFDYQSNNVFAGVRFKF